MSEENTRPVSVAEILARNGTIGSPPVGGHRRRKRRNAVSVAELTGEIPVIRTGEIPVVDDEQSYEDSYEESAVAVSTDAVVVYSAPTEPPGLELSVTDHTDAPDYSDYQDYTPGFDEAPAERAVSGNEFIDAEPVGDTETVRYTESVTYTETVGDVPTGGYVAAVETVEYARTVEYAQPAPVELEPVLDLDTESAPAREPAGPPLSSIPLPRRRRGPERSNDPRPARRTPRPVSGAERMSPDPVDGSVDLPLLLQAASAELVDEQVPDPAELRSYLRSSAPTLFFGETVADDLARRGEVAESGYDGYDGGDDYDGYDDGDDYDGYDDGDADYERDDAAEGEAEAPNRGALSVLGTSLVAVLQSLLAVVFGAGLFIGFDQLWRWNNIVALALSALVIAALMIGVHVVRKTEDFVSTLIAALVGILVTFGPLALQST